MKHALMAAALLSCVALAGVISPVPAVVSSSAADRSTELNRNTIGLMAATPELRDVAVSIANAVDHEGGLRILPVNGKGPIQTLTDLLYLRGIDAALLPSDAVAYATRNSLHPDLRERIAYLIKFASVPVVIVARDDNTSIDDLAGKRVAHDRTGSASFIAAHMVLGGLEQPFSSQQMEPDAVLQALRDGTADAAVFSGLDTADLLAGVRPADRLRILAIPYDEAQADAYLPALLTAKDYPGLIKEEPVETLASALVLAVIKWPNKSPQLQRIKRFSDTLMNSLEKSSGKTLNLAATAPGLDRYVVAEQWLEARRNPETVQKTSRTVLKEN